MQITNAQYSPDAYGGTNIIRADVDGVPMFIPADASSTIYQEILRQVEAGTLTIADAD
jgi:hypothetical protein